jgi:hypothetical protein
VLAGLNLVRPEMTHNNDGQPRLVRLTQYGGLAWPKPGLGCGARRALAHHAEGAGVMARWRGRGRLVGGQDVTRAAKNGPHYIVNPLLHRKLRGRHGKEGLHRRRGPYQRSAAARGRQQSLGGRRWLGVVLQLEKHPRRCETA